MVLPVLGILLWQNDWRWETFVPRVGFPAEADVFTLGEGIEVTSNVGDVWFVRGRSRGAWISTNRMFARVKLPQTVDIYPHLDAEPHLSLWLAVLRRLCPGKDIYFAVVQQALVCPQPNELCRNYMTFLYNVSVNQELLHWSQWDYGTVKVMHVRGKPEPWDEWLELPLSCRISWCSWSVRCRDCVRCFQNRNSKKEEFRGDISKVAKKRVLFKVGKQK